MFLLTFWGARRMF